MNEITLPPGFTIYPGACQCGRTLVLVDHLEGLPIYGCPDECGRHNNVKPRVIKVALNQG
jgi:hypothetical protein